MDGYEEYLGNVDRITAWIEEGKGVMREMEVTKMISKFLTVKLKESW